jgi:hypothetical protein
MKIKGLLITWVILLLLTNFNLAHEVIEEGATSDGYLGMSLPADFQVFNNESPWNIPIPYDAEVDENSDLMIQNLWDTLIDLGYEHPSLGGNYKIWTSPLHVIDSDKCPKIDILTTNIERCLYWTVDPDENGIAEDMPMPEEAWQDPSEDGHMILVDPYKRVAWEFSKAKKLFGGKWVASCIDEWDLNEHGYRPPFVGPYHWKCGVRASGTPYIAGLLRVEEIEAGEINHALAVGTPVNRRKISEDAEWEYELCSPAARTDGWGFGPQFIPEGARIQLNPNLDLDSLNLSEDAEIIARALQEYGAYVVINARGFPIYLQNLGSDGGKWDEHLDELADITKIPLDEFYVLKTDVVVKDYIWTSEYKVSFGEIPQNVRVGESFNLTVMIVDENNEVVDSSRDIMLAMGNNPSAGKIIGNVIERAGNGVAVFSIAIDQPGQGCTLYAMARDLCYGESGSFNVIGKGLCCSGVLSWVDVKPGSTMTGSFTVENVGDPGLGINWSIMEWPGWGIWSFTPSCGDDLKPEDGPVTVDVSVVAPDEQNKGFTGSIKIVNKDNISDFCMVPVSLATPKNKQMISTLFIQFLEIAIEHFPMLEWLLKLPSL